jgi:hypothetical protein
LRVASLDQLWRQVFALSAVKQHDGWPLKLELSCKLYYVDGCSSSRIEQLCNVIQQDHVGVDEQSLTLVSAEVRHQVARERECRQPLPLDGQLFKDQRRDRHWTRGPTLDRTNQHVIRNRLAGIYSYEDSQHKDSSFRLI